MSDFINQILGKMSPTTIHMLRVCDLSTTAERGYQKLNYLTQKMENIKLDSCIEELQARLKMEEREAEMRKLLDQKLTEELSILEDAYKNPAAANINRTDLRVKLDSYKSRLKPSTFNLCAMVDMYEETKEKKEKVSCLEKKVAFYASLSPCVGQAKEDMRKLKAEIQALEANADQDLENDMAYYLHETQDYHQLTGIKREV